MIQEEYKETRVLRHPEEYDLFDKDDEFDCKAKHLVNADRKISKYKVT